MAVAYVQGAQNADGVGTGDGTRSVTLNGTTAGNALLVIASSYNDTAIVSGTPGDGTNTYVNIAGATGVLTGNMQCWSYIATSIAGGNVTFTINWTGGGADFPDLYIIEVSGVNNVSPVDASTVGKNINTLSPTATVTCGSSGDLMVAVAFVSSHVTADDAAYTQKVPSSGNNVNGNNLAVKAGAASGSQTSTWTQNSSGYWVMPLIALQAPGASAPEEIGGFPPMPGMPGAPLILAGSEEYPAVFAGIPEEWAAGQSPAPVVWASSLPFTDEEFAQAPAVQPAMEEYGAPLLGWVTPSGPVPFTYDEEFAQPSIVEEWSPLPPAGSPAPPALCLAFDEEFAQTIAVAPALEEMACIVWPQPLPAAAWLSVDEELGIPTAIAFEEYAPPPAIMFVPIVNAQSLPFTDEAIAVFLPPAASPTRFQPSRLSVRRLMKFR